jgi:hypothetical protein
MDVVIAAVTALSVVFWILCGVAAFKHNETSLIWAAYFAIVLTILVPFLTWQKRADSRPNEKAASTDHFAKIVVTEVNGVPAPGTELGVFRVIFTNTGNTVALRCTFFGQVQIVPKGGAPPAVPDKSPEGQSVANIEPGQTMFASFGRNQQYTFTQDDFQQFRSGERIVYLRGKFQYRDAGGEHWTIFSNRLRRDMIWELDSSGNGTDRDKL